MANIMIDEDTLFVVDPEGNCTHLVAGPSLGRGHFLLTSWPEADIRTSNVYLSRTEAAALRDRLSAWLAGEA